MSDVRLLRESDIAGAMRLNQAAGWNQTPLDWRNVMRLEPEGCFGIESGGELVATATAVCYGTELAWIGMVLTHPDHRGRGYARALMEHSIAFLRSRGIACIKLDATDMGKPLYEKLGFVDEAPIERWSAIAPPLLSPLPGQDREEAVDFALDRAAFGADRKPLLEVLAQIESVATEGGYAFGRPGATARYFGPCVAAGADAARRLAGSFLARHPGEKLYWDVLPGNPEAVKLAKAFDFAPVRRLTRMVIPGPRPLRHDDSKIFAIAGFEYG